MGKICSRCNVFYKNIQQGFHRRKGLKFKAACKECLRIASREYRDSSEERKKPETVKDDREKYGWKWGE